jgi:hypothetical protein
VFTDATGLASAAVTPTGFGAATIEAAAVGATQTASFNAVTRSAAAVRPLEYIAAGATVAWTPQVGFVQNGAPAAGQAVDWTVSAGMAVTAAQSTANALGVAEMAVAAGPLSAGTQATGQACAWSAPATVCAGFAAVGVDPANWRLTAVSGAGQSIGLAGTFAPVMMEVTDLAGDPVAGAPVTIHQTVDAAGPPCPSRGACPVEPEYASGQTTAVSDADGLFTVTPMQVAGSANATNIAVAAGTQGFVSLSLLQGP